MRNITLSADENTIEAARMRAQEEHTTLNDQFRRWLADYARPRNRADLAMRTITDLQRRLHSGGRHFTKDELNER
jgi:hypothetical protein